MKFHNVFALVFMGLLYGGDGCYDSYKLVQLWPQSFCTDPRNNCTPPLPPRFVIHGLWAQGCKPLNTTIFKDEDLKKDMDVYWPDLQPEKWEEYTFWQHQWKKHGLCSKLQLQPKEYFKLAINLTKQIDLLKTLKLADIIPNGSFYYTKNISNAIFGETNLRPEIQCNKDSNNTIQLFQIYLCVDGDEKKLISCNETKPKGCKKRIVFPKNPYPLLQDAKLQSELEDAAEL